MPPLWLIKAGAVLALLAGFWFHGHHAGAANVQAAWDKQARETKDAADAAREVDRIKSSAAAKTYEAQRAAIASRATPRTQEAAYALHATICPAAGTFARPLELGDVPVPGAELERLRSAGADY